MLQEYKTSGHLPQAKAADSLANLLAKAGRGKYLAIMAYVCQTPEVDEVLTELRGEVVKRYHIATTLGYGPRFLHSSLEQNVVGRPALLLVFLNGQIYRGYAEKGEEAEATQC